MLFALTAVVCFIVAGVQNKVVTQLEKDLPVEKTKNTAFSAALFMEEHGIFITGILNLLFAFWGFWTLIFK